MSIKAHGVALSLTLFGLLSMQASAQTLTTVRVASGLSSPLYVTSPPGDTERLFIVEQDGLIKIMKNGTVLPTPFFNGTSLTNGGGERGMLGFAFHPNYASNGFFYISYTMAVGGDSVVARGTVSANPDIANPTTTPILGPINQPFSNHNGGCIQFGPDGKLYVGMGDGGSANDPGCRAQKGGTLLGKILRLEDDGAIPADNPFISNSDVLSEIWSYGLRNPWRFSFDRLTGDMYIGDVGQGQFEEISFQAAASTGGENYGWKVMEGTQCFSTSACPPLSTPACNAPSLTDPIHTYRHVSGNCSITGGYVYRGCGIPSLSGTYFFADYCSAQIWSLEYDGTSVSNLQLRTTELTPNVGSINTIASFGEDGLGELYIVDIGGEIFKIMEVGGDCNGNNIADNCEPGFSVARNGGGTNPAGFVEVTPPVVGNNWNTTIDIATPGALGSILAVGDGGPTSGTFLSGLFQGELLCLPPFGTVEFGTGAHNPRIPNDCNLIGQTFCAQGATFVPGQITLNNALDFTIGAL